MKTQAKVMPNPQAGKAQQIIMIVFLCLLIGSITANTIITGIECQIF